MPLTQKLSAKIRSIIAKNMSVLTRKNANEIEQKTASRRSSAARNPQTQTVENTTQSNCRDASCSTQELDIH